MRAAATLFIGGLLLVAGVVAATTSAVLRVKGPVAVTSGSLTGPVEAVFCGQASALRTFAGHAATLNVDSYEATYVTMLGQSVRSSLSHASFTLTRVTISLSQGNQAGWFGGELGGQPTRISSVAPFSVELAPARALGNAVGPAAPDARAFGHQTGSPALDPKGEFALSTRGWTSVKLDGPDVLLTASENTTTLVTGEDQGPSPGTVRDRWALLTFEAADLDIGLSHCDIALGASALDWSGTLTAHQATGKVEIDGAAYQPNGSDAELTGPGHGEVAPSGDSLDLTITNATVTSSNVGARLAAPASGPSWLPWLALVLGITAAGSAALWVRDRRRNAAPELVPDDLVQIAYSALDRDDPDEALKWIKLARERAPRSSRLMLDEGFIHEQRGDLREALGHYQQALQVGAEPGDTLVIIARTHFQLGERAQALDALLRALEHAPLAALDIEADDALSTLAAEPDLQAALHRARDRIDRD